MGPLSALAGNRTVWLDGGHNPDAGQAIARHFASCEPLHLVMGMLTSKDPSAILRPLEGKLASVSIVPAPGHEAHTPADFAPFTSLPVASFANVAEALAALPPGGDVLIAGSLYLAGDVLRRNDEAPD
jgi:dihydrofolate synthase/folylpolyglutamate synthase